MIAARGFPGNDRVDRAVPLPDRVPDPIPRLMKVCIVAVGSELLTPFRVDTNSLAITERLNAIGGDVRLKAIVGDDVEELVRVIEGALGWADLVAITGGLGPTEDDITRDAVARVMKIPLEIDPRIVESLRERFATRGLKMSDNNARQAMVPRGATVLENPNGSAPGSGCSTGAPRWRCCPARRAR